MTNSPSDARLSASLSLGAQLYSFFLLYYSPRFMKKRLLDKEGAGQEGGWLGPKQGGWEPLSGQEETSMGQFPLLVPQNMQEASGSDPHG